MNHFQLFNLPISYPVDTKALDREYFALQIRYHPDKAQEDSQKLEFLKRSTEINEAYKILKNDQRAASYLLKLHDIDIENESMNYPLPPESLEQIWNDRQELEEAEDITAFLAHKIKERKDLLAMLKDAFEKNAYDKAAIFSIRLKYLDSLISSAR